MNAARLLAAAEAYETPLAAVDLAAMEANLVRMARLVEALGARLRPHAKTHKSAYVAQRQLAQGAAGLTAATLTEAEVFLAAGVRDLLVAHPPVGEPKLRRLAALAEQAPRLAVALDDVEVAASLPPGVEVLWEVDSGLHRIGTQPGPPTAEAVASLLEVIGPGRFRGLITHGGHAYRAHQDAELLRATRDEAGSLLATAGLLRERGIEVRELSVGSTPTTRHAHRFPGATEMRPGTYVYGDANQVQLGSQALEECALAVVATVVSTPEAGRSVVDAGSKTLSADLRVPGLETYGLVLGREDLRVERLSEEHAVVSGPGLRVGDRVLILPAHVCTCVNLQPALLMVEPDGGSWWDPVSARGWRGVG